MTLNWPTLRQFSNRLRSNIWSWLTWYKTWKLIGRAVTRHINELRSLRNKRLQVQRWTIYFLLSCKCSRWSTAFNHTCILWSTKIHRRPWWVCSQRPNAFVTSSMIQTRPSTSRSTNSLRIRSCLLSRNTKSSLGKSTSSSLVRRISSSLWARSPRLCPRICKCRWTSAGTRTRRHLTASSGPPKASALSSSTCLQSSNSKTKWPSSGTTTASSRRRPSPTATSTSSFRTRASDFYRN